MSVPLRAGPHTKEDNITRLLDPEYSQRVQPLFRVRPNSSLYHQSPTSGAVYQSLCFQWQGHVFILLHPEQRDKVSLGCPAQPLLPLSPLTALAVSHFILTDTEHIYIFISYDVMF